MIREAGEMVLGFVAYVSFYTGIVTDFIKVVCGNSWFYFAANNI